MVASLRSAARAERVTSLLLVDLDEFKVVNDTQGHVVGDELLCAVSRQLTEQCRGRDQVGRLGGDEFAVLLPDCDAASATALAERIRRQLASEGPLASG